ncbi:MAG: DUF4065 domain-containing protein [Candidatus Adiutrix sp.]|jgi:uncharacterized phage-associated protein|nr:DUF4065 domain-containing protein [Candidatus Adiutrix sp.]
MPSVFDVADYFIAKNDPREGDRMTNLRLQKLVYYAQGFCLALLNRPLFNEPIEAWRHGPVCEALYHKYKSFGSEPLDTIYKTKREAAQALKSALKPFAKDEIEVLDEVFEVYGQYTASRLRQLSHDTPPWQQAFPDGVISKASMKEFFATQIKTSDGTSAAA